jgi:peptidoglycan L-alanyl-D-glutamate endopeptidase CwlK|tara:strand:+ start:10167 stop:10619 length:453 start_codon:yes stop_codon:yes gene_type:complete
VGYKLGKRSLSRLEGVNDDLVTVVKYAIGVTKQDFSVICGLRTIDEQKALVAKGASQTMKSKHIDGNAVDLMAYCNGGRWELNLYDEIADAMKEGAAACNVKLRWGAAWTIDDIGVFEGTAENAMNSYIDTRRSQSRRPFIDAPHFELML